MQNACESALRVQACGIRLETPEFINDIIKPYENVLRYMGAAAGIYRIIELLDREGGCPSVVDVGKRAGGPEDEYPKLRDILMRVTLRSHSFRVARLSMDLLKQDYREGYEYLTPITIVAALGHDLGKLPSLRPPGHYVKGEHVIGSEKAIKEIFQAHYDAIESARDEETRAALSHRARWIDDAREAVLNHHRTGATGFTARLRKADGMAREMEVAEITKGRAKSIPWSEWFDPGTFLKKYVRPEIHYIDEYHNWRAFLFGSVVYCEPAMIYEAAVKYAKDKNVASSALMRSGDKDAILKEIVSSLKDAKAVSPELGRAYYKRAYAVKMSGGMILNKSFVPLNVEAIGSPAEIDHGKDRFFFSIKNVRLRSERES